MNIPMRHVAPTMAAAFLAVAVSAQDSPQAISGKNLALEDAVRRARARNATIPACQAGIETARARYERANDLRNPELRVSRRDNIDTRRSSLGSVTEDIEEYQAALRVFPPNPFSVHASRGKEKALIGLARAKLGVARNRIAAQVKRLFIDIVYFRDDLKLVRQMEQIEEQHSDLVAKLEKKGQRTSLEAMEASLNKIQWRKADYAIRRQLQAQLNRLETMLGMENLEEFALAGSQSATKLDPDNLDAEYLRDIAVTNRAEYIVPAHMRDAAEADWKLARANQTPWISHIQGSYNEERIPGDNHAWEIQLALDIPLFSLFQNDKAVRHSEMIQQRYRMAAAKQTIGREIRAALQDLQTADYELRRLAEETKPVLKQMKSLIQRSDDAMKIDPKTYSDIRKGIVRAQRDRLATRHDYNLARLRLEEMTGIGLDDLKYPASAEEEHSNVK